MFNRLITKIFLKLNPYTEIISTDELNDLEKAKRDYLELYKQKEDLLKAFSTRKEYDVRTYVAVELLDRHFIDVYSNNPDLDKLIKNKLANKMLDAIKDNMTFNRAGEDSYGVRYEATIKLVSNTEKECGGAYD